MIGNVNLDLSHSYHYMQQFSAEDYLFNEGILSALSPPSGGMPSPLLLELAFKVGNSSHTASQPRFNLFEQTPYGKPGVKVKLHSSDLRHSFLTRSREMVFIEWQSSVEKIHCK